MTGELNDIEIIEGELEDLRDVYQRFLQDFPPDEIKKYEHLELLLAKKNYRFLLAKHKIFDEIVGYAFTYEFEHVKAIWLDYMAIDERYRNAGYGTLLFNKIAQSKQDGIIGMFIEVEIPEEEDGPKREEQLRRINFYERLGARKLNVPYQLPTNSGGFPMYLYFRPSSNVQLLPKKQIQEAIAEVFGYIHSDVNERETILKEFISLIQDEHFK
ncbi:GNAT family N-acetyltransferase [Neobacillus sp. Marseille-QA0830]